MAKILVNFIKSQVNDAHEWLEGTIDGVTNELANEPINPKVMTIGGQYAHIVTGIDIFFFEKVAEKQPLYKSSLKGQTGMSVLPDDLPMDKWIQDLRLDLEAAKKYCTQVFKAVNEYLDTVEDEYLISDVDLNSWGMGMQPRHKLITMGLFNAMAHTGEIAYMKGLKGLKGYPW